MEKNDHSIVYTSSFFGHHGFTLVELMLAVALSGIIATSVGTAYFSQRRVYLAQEQVVEMQQNIRAALDILVREGRMAGYDPTQLAGAGITAVTAGQLSFTQDITDTAGTTPLVSDGMTDGPGENLTYELFVEDGIQKLVRHDNNGALAKKDEVVAENFDGLEFVYLDDTGAATTILSDIRSVQVSILARAGKLDRSITNTSTYTAASGATWGPYNDNFRRLLLIDTIQLRNRGV